MSAILKILDSYWPNVAFDAGTTPALRKAALRMVIALLLVAVLPALPYIFQVMPSTSIWAGVVWAAVGIAHVEIFLVEHDATSGVLILGGVLMLAGTLRNSVLAGRHLTRVFTSQIGEPLTEDELAQLKASTAALERANEKLGGTYGKLIIALGLFSALAFPGKVAEGINPDGWVTLWHALVVLGAIVGITAERIRVLFLGSPFAGSSLKVERPVDAKICEAKLREKGLGSYPTAVVEVLNLWNAPKSIEHDAK